MTNTIFDNQGNTSISIQANETSVILFQYCQFFVNTAIYITSATSYSTAHPQMSIQMENCFISTAEHKRRNSDWVIFSTQKVLLAVWNVTIYTNNSNYTSCKNLYLGDNISIRESCFMRGKYKGFQIYLCLIHTCTVLLLSFGCLFQFHVDVQ